MKELREKISDRYEELVKDHPSYPNIPIELTKHHLEQLLLERDKEVREELNKNKIYIVMYRGNGYGNFRSKKIAEEFGEFIMKRNEKKLRYGNRLGQYYYSLHELGIIDALESEKRT